MSSAAAWARPGRPINPATGKPYGLIFPSSPSRDMVRAQAMLLDHLGIDKLLSVARRLDGRHAGAAMGGVLSGPRLFRGADRLRRAPLGAEHRLPRSRPPGDHGRSRLAKGGYLDEGTQPCKGLAVARMAAHITYLSEAALHGSSAAACRTATSCPSASTPISRSNPICIIRARPSSIASTPTPISTSPAPWTISTSPRTMAACWPKPSAAADAILHRLLHQRLAVPDGGEQAHRPCPERGRGPGQLRRDRDRQGPRRLPAGRAGNVRHRPGLPQARPPINAACAVPEGASMNVTCLRTRCAPDLARRSLADRRDDRPGPRVLDVGCGDGTLLRHLAEQCRRPRHRNFPGRT